MDTMTSGWTATHIGGALPARPAAGAYVRGTRARRPNSTTVRIRLPQGTQL